MDKSFPLKTYDKNVLILLMRLGGECRAEQLHAAIPELNWDMFAKYIRVLQRKHKAIIIMNEKHVEKDTIVKADIEVQAILKG